jgi:hypothetical protein
VLLPSDLAAGPVVYLLEIEWGGQTVRVAESTLHDLPFGDFGASVSYDGALDVSPPRRALSLFSQTPSERVASCSLVLAGLLDATGMLSDGHILQGARARLYLHAVGSSRRELVIDGIIDGVEFGAIDEPLTFVVRQSISDDLGSTHPQAQILGVPGFGASGSVWTWDGDFAGEYLPVVIGKPGSGDGSAFGSPAFGLNHVAGGTISAGVAAHPVAATSVYIENFDNGQSGTLSILSQYSDLRGRRVALADLSPWSPPRWSPGDEMWVDWGASAGGAVDASGALIRGAGDVVEFILRNSTAQVDWGRMLAVLPLLNGYKIDAAIVRSPDEPVRPWEWLSEHVLPMLPVSVANTARGLSLSLWRPDAVAADAVAALEAGRNCSRASAVAASDADDIRNEIEVLYGWDAKANAPTRRVVLTGSDSTLSDDPDSVESHRLRVSADRYGRRPADPVKATAVWDDGTAHRIASWMAHRASLPSLSVAYDISNDSAWLTPGAVVTLTDSGLGWSNRLAVVEDTTHADGAPAVSLRLYEHP